MDLTSIYYYITLTMYVCMPSHAQIVLNTPTSMSLPTAFPAKEILIPVMDDSALASSFCYDQKKCTASIFL